MDLVAFKDWKKAPTPKKLAALFADNERIVAWAVNRILSKTEYATASLREDAMQNGRIGLLRAIRTWNDRLPRFGHHAHLHIRKEVQMGLKYATPVTCPSGGPRVSVKKQEEAAAFFAKYGREPTPSELGVAQSIIVRHAKAAVRFAPVSAAEHVPVMPSDTEIEADIDRQRDMRALRAFLDTLSAADKKKFWTGKDAGLTERARVFVEGRRGQRKQS